MPKKKAYEVYVEGKYGEINEDKLGEFADSLLGERIGSGCSLPDMIRDIQYHFSTKKRAESFMLIVQNTPSLKVTSCTLSE